MTRVSRSLTVRGAAALLALSLAAGPASAESRIEEVPQADGGVRKVAITPGPIQYASVEGVAITPAVAHAAPAQAEAPAAADEADGAAATRSGRSYREVYNSIPYHYTDWLANPGYRHDATMEILLGQLRPTVIHSHQSARHAESAPDHHPWFSPATPYSFQPGLLYPFGYYDFSRGPYSLYQGLFGYRGGFRPMYYVNGGYGYGHGPWHW